MKIKAITYRAGYKLFKDYQGVHGSFEATAKLEEGEDTLTALRAEVRRWVEKDEEIAQGYLSQLICKVNSTVA